MLNNDTIGRTITEKDRPILNYLADVRLVLHEQGFGFDLLFVFEKNSYFVETELKKTFVMAKNHVIEKCLGSAINW